MNDILSRIPTEAQHKDDRSFVDPVLHQYQLMNGGTNPYPQGLYEKMGREAEDVDWAAREIRLSARTITYWLHYAALDHCVETAWHGNGPDPEDLQDPANYDWIRFDALYTEQVTAWIDEMIEMASDNPADDGDDGDAAYDRCKDDQA